MRKALYAIPVLMLAFAQPAAADGAQQDFTLVNKTGYELKEVYVSPSKADDWQEDILGKDALGDGNRVKIHFSPKVQTCKWDLKVVYTEDSSSAVWNEINLCDVDKITIHYDKDRDVTKATFD
jgi:hypothetical protein